MATRALVKRVWTSGGSEGDRGKPGCQRPTVPGKLREPGRMAEFLKTFKSAPADTEKQLPSVKCPALVIMGTADPDFADPRAEGDGIVAAMPAGAGAVAMVGGAGHYPHAQSPDAVAELVIPFLKEHAGA
jgi:pimeloyl-ACP methyl ester carboxylesterase